MKKRLTIAAVLLLGLVIALEWIRQSLPPEAVWEGQTVTNWALQLNSALPQTRERATAAVQRFDSGVVPSLVRMLQSPDPILGPPLVAMANHLPRRPAALLLRLVGPSDPPFKRLCAAQALSLMGPKARQAVPALSRGLADGDERVAWNAARALARMGDAGTTALVAALAPGSGLKCSAQVSVCYALSTAPNVVSNGFPALVHVMQTGCAVAADQAATTLGSMGKAAVPCLIESLAHRDLHARMRAMKALGSIGVGACEAIPQLISIAQTDETRARAAAIGALGQIRLTAPQVAEVLAQALRDPALEVRLNAIQGLGRSLAIARKALPELTAALQDQSASVRAGAAGLLGQMRPSTNTVVAALRQCLEDPKEEVRISARQALEQLGVD